MDFVKYIKELRTTCPEEPVEPQLKNHRQQLDKKLREELDLGNGAVLMATVEKGDGFGSPKEGDLVFVHFAMMAEDDRRIVFSTRREDGGAGYPAAFLIEKGRRPPRAFEIALKNMCAGETAMVKARADYMFAHPECGMASPPGVSTSSTLGTRLTLLGIVPAATAHAFGAGNGGGDAGVIKRVVEPGSAWESPRPPYQVSIHVTCAGVGFKKPARVTIGDPGSTDVSLQNHLAGSVFFSTLPALGGGAAGAPLVAQLGFGALPPAVEDALSYMSVGETATFIVAADRLRAEGAASAASGAEKGRDKSDEEDEGKRRDACLISPPPKGMDQAEIQVSLLSQVQVRDMTGTGEVTKLRVRDGTGEFPIHCALNDTTFQFYYKVRPVENATNVFTAAASLSSSSSSAGTDAAPEECTWVYDSRQAGSAPLEEAKPLEADTGCGDLPEGLEMCLKLMLPGEVARCRCAPRYAYQGRDDAPAGISGESPVEFEIEMVSFEREGHWQTISFETRYEIAERVKTKANELYRCRRFAFAKARYARLLKLLNSTRDFETEEQLARLNGYKTSCAANLAACALETKQFAEAAVWCDQVLELDPLNVRAAIRRGRALTFKGDYEAAAEALEKALEMATELLEAEEAAAAGDMAYSEGTDDSVSAAREVEQEQKEIADKGIGGSGSEEDRKGTDTRATASSAAAAAIAEIKRERQLNVARKKAATQKQREQFGKFFQSRK